MTATASHRCAIICAENIAFLFLLHPVPHRPLRNTLHTPKNISQGYVLSVEDERKLVESLAFLANDSDDINHIPALCIEQHPTTSSLNVLLAVNRYGWDSGTQSLQRLQEGFDKVFVTLADVVHSGGERDILTAIVTMCAKRILLRMRLLRNRRVLQKRNIRQMLHSAIDALKRLGPRSTGSTTGLFVEKARLVIKSTDAWERHQTIGQLSELVDSVHDLKRAVDTEALLGVMTARDMDPSSRRSLVNTIDKVARYREICRYLYRMSRKSALFQRMTLTTINLPMEAYHRPPGTCTAPSLRSVLLRANPTCRESDITRMRRLISTAHQNVDQEFSTRVAQTLTKSKIHAEIQLLYYSELNPCTLPPRVVASSKDACFLCNAFVTLHGKMHTARCHGRLYPGWRLPSILAFVDLEERFNAVLSGQIYASFVTLLARGQRTVYPDPNESTLLTLPHSASTLQDLLGRGGGGGGGGAFVGDTVASLLAGQSVSAVYADSTISTSEEDESPSSSEEENSGNELPTEGDLTEQAENVSLRSDGEETGGSSTSNKAVTDTMQTMQTCAPKTWHTHTSTDSSELKLIKGRPITPDVETRLFHAGMLDIYLEHPVEDVLVHQARLSKSPSFSLEWLDDIQAEQITANDEINVVEVEHLHHETTYEVDGQGVLFMATGGVVVRLAIRSGPV